MKRVYENMKEIAEDFTDGTSWTHAGRKHDDDPCIAWHEGVRDFAEWLDSVGIEIIQNPEVYEELWKFRR